MARGGSQGQAGAAGVEAPDRREHRRRRICAVHEASRSAGRAGGAWDALLDNDQWDAYNDQKGDLTRDTRACERWWPFLDGILADDQLTVNFLAGKKSDAYTNLSVSVWDGWERDLVYVSPPPHQSYLLFSMGPDGTYDSKEPDNRDSPANKDNIYGDVGFVQR